MSKARLTRSDVPALEWTVGALGTLIFCAMLAVLVMTGLREQAPPSISIEPGRIAQVAGGYVIEFEARNDGDTTAADVEIVATSRDGEKARAQFDYLPPHSTRRGGVFFSQAPNGVRFAATGYNDP